MLEPLALFKRRLHPQVGGTRQNAFCERQDALYIEFLELAGVPVNSNSVSSSRSFSALAFVSADVDRPLCTDIARRSFSFRQQSQLLRAEAAAVRQDRDQAGATTGRFHALVATLPVKIAAYSSGSNGMRTKLALPVRDPTTTPCRSMVSTIALALALSRSSASVTSRRSLLYRSGWAVLTS